jgi:hypothetical protein
MASAVAEKYFPMSPADPAIQEELLRTRIWTEAALDYAKGTHLLVDVWKAIEDGLMQFWPGERSVVVTEVTVYPRMKVVGLFLAGGDLSEILEDMLPCIERWAVAHGASRITGAGRKGWAKVMSDYTAEWTVLRKEIG